MQKTSSIDLTQLSANRSGLEALAANLLNDFHGGEDLAQESVLRNLASGGPEKREQLTAWLRTTVRRLASNERRSRFHRRGREMASARHEALPSTAEIAAQAEICRKLHEELNALPEEQASLLRDVYFGGLSVAEVAARDGSTSNTIKSRVRRAREALRQRFEGQSFRGDVHWAVAIAPVAKAGFRGGKPAAAAAVGTWVTAGAVGLVLVAVGVLGWKLSQPTPAGVVAPLAPHSVAEVDEPALIAESGGDRIEVAVAEPSAAQASLPSTEVSGRVVDLRGGPIVGARVRVSRSSKGPTWPGALDFEDEDYPALGFECLTDEEGTFRLAFPFPRYGYGELRVTPDPFHLVLEGSFGRVDGIALPLLREGAIDVGELPLAPGGALSGRVTDASSAPVAGVEVQLGSLRRGMLSGFNRWISTTDHEGRYALEHLPLGNFAVMTMKSGFVDAAIRDVPVRSGELLEQPDIQLARSQTLGGRVVDEHGQGMPGLVVGARPRESFNSGGSDTTLEDGAFEIVLRVNEEHRMSVVAEGYARDDEAGEGPLYFPPGTDDIIIKLRPSNEASTRFLVVDAVTDESIGAFGLRVFKGTGTKANPRRFASGSIRGPSDHPGGLAEAVATEGVDEVQISSQGYLVFRGDVHHDDAGTPLQTIRLSRGGSVTGRILDGDGALANAKLTVKCVRGPLQFDFREAKLTTSDEGRFECHGLVPGGYEVKSEDPRDSMRTLQTTFNVSGTEAVDLGELALAEPGDLQGRVLVPVGVSPEGLEVSIVGKGDTPRAFVDVSGRFHLKRAPAGAARIQVDGIPGQLHASPKIDVVIPEGGVAEATMDMRLAGLAEVELVVGIEGVRPEDIRVRLEHDLNEVVGPWYPVPLSPKYLGYCDASGYVAGVERAAGESHIVLDIRGLTRITLHDPVLQLQHGSRVVEKVQLALGTLKVELPGAMSIQPGDRMDVHLWHESLLVPVVQMILNFDDEATILRRWGVPDGFVRAGQTLTIPGLPAGAYEVSVMLTEDGGQISSPERAGDTFVSQSARFVTRAVNLPGGQRTSVRFE